MMDFHKSTADLAGPGSLDFAILRRSKRLVRRGIEGGVCLHPGVWPGNKHEKGLKAAGVAHANCARATGTRTATPDRLSAGI